MHIAVYFGLAFVAYVLGSIPFGLILVRVLLGKDVRLTGSGNIGATNVARSGGAKLGVATLLLDALKGYFAVLLASLVSLRVAGIDLGLAASLAALCAILGHVFPAWLRFRGGKGVATAVGAFVGLAPRAILVVFAVFLVTVLISRYVSLGSIIASAVFPLLAFFLYRNQSSPAGLAVMLGASLLIILKHKANIRRLLDGTENRLQFHKS
ncbi:MAG: acyl-phosphate glycerol 3-phosphate acyltransferase [Acidobacteria bacterium]|nr:MAG: acyl-phosphate glycerol 3-phosphate acyltransferase [Acidobacteriota bacterium]PYY22563.1 MAG: acyl-phosphate glycerol 3-phosphate acyltransferase [Acidobacteriota bacterium]